MKALGNLKILDLSTLLPGPFASMMLADMGADVLRVESPTRPDLVREMPPKKHGISSKHAHLNRNKKAITLDLKNPAAITILKELVSEYDILLEQFRPGVMDRLGLGYDSLKALNPKLIYCSVTGYGQTGPYKNRGGHDNNYLSVSGLNSYSGRKGDRTPIMGTQIADLAGGSLHAVIGILAAVNQRSQTGLGQHVDISMTDCSFALNVMFGADYLMDGTEPKPGSTLLNGGSFYDYYETQDGRFMSVGSLEPHFFQRLCERIGGDELLALGMDQTPESQKSLRQQLEQIFMTKTQSHWIEIFKDADACVEPVLSFAESCQNEQIVARNMVVDVPAGNKSFIRQIGSAIKFSNSKPVYDSVGGKLGKDNETVLQSLGYTESEIKNLKDSKAI